MSEGNFATIHGCLRQVRRPLAVVLFLALTVPIAAAQEASTCDEELEAAESAYVEGRFDDAIQTAVSCLDRADIETAQAVEGYRLLALALIRKDELPDARAAIVRLLDVYPEYEPDPIVDPPSYTALVDIVRQQVGPQTADVSEPAAAEPSWFRQNMKWILPGGAVVFGGFLAAVLSGGNGGGGSNTLPPPPGAPN